MTRLLRSVVVDQTVDDLTRQRIHRAYDLFDQVIVSFSGGKDSTVMLNLTIEVARARDRLPVDVVFWDEEVLAPETVAYVERVAARPEVALRWFALPVTHRNGCSTRSPYWYPFDPAVPEKWVRQPPPHAVTRLPGFARQPIPAANSLITDPRRTVGMLVGLRANESLNRRRIVLMHREDNYICGDPHAPGVALIKPIYDWRTVDVWTAPRLYGWDYNRAYDLMEKAGISPSIQRVAPPYGEQPMQSLWMWHVCWPEVWDRMADRVPGARTAARYALTELYGAGSKLTVHPPPGMTWKEAVLYYLDRHPPEERAFCAKRLQQFIRYHKNRTREPIPEFEPHPETGLCWTWILRIAIRGDLKGREDPHDLLVTKMIDRREKGNAEHGTRY